jgi:hypothetical protein
MTSSAGSAAATYGRDDTRSHGAIWLGWGARGRAGITSDETFLSGNVGGGLKWYAPNRRWGLRADYRVAVTQSKDDAPEFFGRDARYVHRVYAGVIINTAR